MKDYIRQLKYWWNCKSSGLDELADDLRDLHIRDLFAETTTANDVNRRLFPTFIKDQKWQENCSFQAWSNNLAIYFGEEVSARWLTAKAYVEGLCSEGGRANLRSGAKVAQKWGVVFEKDCPSHEELPFSAYVNVDFETLDPIAEKNKIASYWRVDTAEEYLECINRGYAVTLGRTWLTSMNTSQLSSPWIINRTGISIGGHSTVGIGHSGDNTTELNSYGEVYGDKGLFHCPLKDLQNDIDQYGAFAVIPVHYSPKDIKVKTIQQTIKSLTDKLNMLSASNVLYGTAKGLLGENLAPKWQPLGCATSVSFVISRTFNEDIDYPHTDDLLAYLKKSPKWQQVNEPEKGCVIISPTGEIPSYSPLKGDKAHGHCGIMGQFKADDGSVYIMSNNGEEKCWDTKFTFKKWTDYFITYGKVPTYFFKRIA